MRSASAPRSWAALRAAERMSTSDAVAIGNDADDDVLTEAEDQSGGDRLDMGGLVGLRRLARDQDAPVAVADDRLGLVVDARRRYRIVARHDVGIGVLLRRDLVVAGIGDRLVVGARSAWARSNCGGSCGSVEMSIRRGSVTTFQAPTAGSTRTMSPTISPRLAAPAPLRPSRQMPAKAASARMAASAASEKPSAMTA